MNQSIAYKHHRFPPEIIQYAVWRYHRPKPMLQAQCFLGAHGLVYNLFNLGRHLASAGNYRYFRLRAFATWEKAVVM